MVSPQYSVALKEKASSIRIEPKALHKIENISHIIVYVMYAGTSLWNPSSEYMYKVHYEFHKSSYRKPIRVTISKPIKAKHFSSIIFIQINM